MHQNLEINNEIREIEPELTPRFKWKPEKKNTERDRERGFHYNSEQITMVITPISHARISGFC